MSKQLQLRGGTTTEHSTFTGAAREVTVDTTKDTLVVHDGATAGGSPLATESYADAAAQAIVDAAPAALDTLNELAAALGDDANFSTTVTNSIATKLPLAGGTMTGAITFAAGQTFDGRDVSADGTKLDGIESGATADQTAQEIATAIDADATAEATLKTALGLGTAAYTASTAYATAAQGALADSAVQNLGDLSITATSTELNYVDGVTSAIQTQIDGKQASGTYLSQGGSITSGTVTTLTSTTANIGTVDLGDWTVTESAGVLYFATGGTNKMKLDASGNLTVVGDVTAYGTI